MIIGSANPDFLTFLVSTMIRAGYPVQPALPVMETFLLAAQQQPQLVMLDVRVRALDETLALVHMLRLSPMTVDIPLILLTVTRAIVQLHQDPLILTGCRIFPKPFKIDDLVSEIEAILRDDRDASRFR